MVLPHELLPWLKRNNAFPKVSAAVLSQYWHHFQNLKIDWAAASKGLEETLHPVFLWGDDVQYNESYEKLIVVCIGHCLDKRTFSLETCWPIFTIREVPLQESSTCVHIFLGYCFGGFYSHYSCSIHVTSIIPTIPEVLSIGFPTLYALLQPATRPDPNHTLWWNTDHHHVPRLASSELR